MRVAGYLGRFLWAICQETPHAALQVLHVHLLGRFGVINLNDVDLDKRDRERKTERGER